MFESAGMENPKLGTVIVGILKIVFTFITIFIMNRFRRKLFMQVSLGIETYFRLEVQRCSRIKLIGPGSPSSVITAAFVFNSYPVAHDRLSSIVHFGDRSLSYPSVV